MGYGNGISWDTGKNGGPCNDYSLHSSLRCVAVSRNTWNESALDEFI